MRITYYLCRQSLTIMKRVLYIFVYLLMWACTPMVNEEELDDKQQCEMRILTRSVTEMNYPIVLYAFDVSTGEMTSSVTLTSDNDDAVLLLSKGNYQLVALTGVSIVEDNPTLNDVIDVSSSMTIPLQMGSATVYASQNATVSIMLYNQVAAIDMQLCDIPTDATEVGVTLSMLYGGLSYDGTLSGNATATIPLTKDDDGCWNADRFYVLPTCNDQLTLSISIVTPDGMSLYAYSHRKPLLANTPYSLVGTLTSGLAINSTIEVMGWNAVENINFYFGDSSQDESGDSEVDDSEIYMVPEIPYPCELWDNHFVAAREELTDTTAVLVLLSATEWTDIPSAYNSEMPEMAASIVDDYSEGGLTGWSMPTRDDVKLLKLILGDEMLEETNGILATYAMPVLQAGEEVGGNPIRYLCDNATYSFVWNGSNISKCGSKRNYHLRAIKKVKVVKKS